MRPARTSSDATCDLEKLQVTLLLDDTGGSATGLDLDLMPRYLVAGVEGLEGVGESLLVAVFSEGRGVVGTAAHASVPVTDQSVGHHQGNVVWVGPSASWRNENKFSYYSVWLRCFLLNNN